MAHVEYLLVPTGMYQCKASRLSRVSFFLFGPNPISGVGPFFCLMSILAPAVCLAQTTPPSEVHATYVGSAACKVCHADTYSRWKNTRMANVVRDPREHPNSILPELSVSDPLLTFAKDEIALVYGSKWKQRYFKKVGGDYFPLPAQWDVSNKVWRAYFVREGTDWWTPFYPADNMKRPTGPLCDGCHSVNYNIQTRTATEWNVGRENAMAPVARILLDPLEPLSSIQPTLTSSLRTTFAFSAIPKDGLYRIRSKASTTTGPLAFTSAST